MRENGFYWVKFEGEMMVVRYVRPEDEEEMKDGKGYWRPFEGEFSSWESEFEWISPTPLVPPVIGE